MKKAATAIAALAAAAAAAFAADYSVSADSYAFVWNDASENASSSLATGACAISTSTRALATSALASALSARYRTRLATGATGLVTRPRKGFVMVVR